MPIELGIRFSNSNVDKNLRLNIFKKSYTPRLRAFGQAFLRKSCDQTLLKRFVGKSASLGELKISFSP